MLTNQDRVNNWSVLKLYLANPENGFGKDTAADRAIFYHAMMNILRRS